MPLNNFGIVVKGLYRSAQPDEQGIKDLAGLGIDTIIRLSHSSEGDLSSAREEELFKPGVLIQDDFPEMFRAGEYMHVKIRAADIKSLLGLNRNILLHCSHGRDRTGLISGAYKIIYCGASYGQVMEDRRIFGTNMILDWSADAADLAILKKLADEQVKQ